MRSIRLIWQRIGSLSVQMNVRRALAFGLRWLMHPILYLHWHQFLVRFAQANRLGLPHDDLIRKALPIFFTVQSANKRRLHLLTKHFTLAQGVFSPAVIRAMWQGFPVDLGKVTGKRHLYAAQLRLSDHLGARHEGAFSLRLSRCSDDFELCVLSFILYQLPQQPYTVAVGGLQGPYDANAKRILIEATRDLHGLRPKDAALLILEGVILTQENSTTENYIQAVSNASHVINFRGAKRRARMHSNMDHYWQERGGLRGGEFGFLLPLRNAHLVKTQVEPQGKEQPASLSKRELCKSAFIILGQKLLMCSGGCSCVNTGIYEQKF